MSEIVALTINGVSVRVPAGYTVSAAVMTTGVASLRRSVTGEARGPLCGMGICYECRVTINGEAHCRSCQILCQDGMDVRTE